MVKNNKKHFKNYNKDLEFMYIASTYNMVDEYKLARRRGRNPYQALMEWDLPIPQSGLQPTQCSANAQSQHFQRN